ncbi:MAG TPA: PLP-dependent aminotransferase family protein [Anaerolineaceae bacterium]|jgi:2-aminoadipate transaminase
MQETLWDHRYAQRTQRMSGSAIREILKLTEQPDIISFGGGLPSPDVFPLERIRLACDRILSEQAAYVLQYGTTEGYLPLREMLAGFAARHGINVTAENVLMTSGSQQALDLLGKIFINPGDRILVETPTYLGALQAWNAYGAEYVSVHSDEQGIDPDSLEKELRCGAKLLYVIPNFQNPTGMTIPFERRKRIIELADQFGVPIIEDDPYGQLRFEGDPITPILAMDSKARNSGTAYYRGNVIYLSTFSKIMAPGIRLAWVIAPPEVIRKLVMAKQGADLNTSTLNQALAYEVGRDGFIDQHVNLIRKVYKNRRDVMLDALTEFMPEGVRWTHPLGGLFLWTILPEKIDTANLLKKAIQRKVAFVPGASFHPNGGGHNTMRLNFSYSNQEKIIEGISRLGGVVKESL